MPDSYADNMVRNSGEATRLDEQFDLLSTNIGYILHSSVQENLPANPHVADIGTGTGIFLCRIHDLYPGGVLDGFDISGLQFRSKDALPPNVTLSILDIKQPVPAELKRRYDLVHVRMLGAAILPKEWRSVVKNATELLKPGGWLQWEECDFSGVMHMRGRVDSTVDTARLMGKQFRIGLRERFEHGWNTLSEDMKSCGLASVKTDMVSSDRVSDTRERMTSNGMQAIFSWARLMALNGVPLEVEASCLDEMEQAAFGDIKSGCYVRFNIHIAYGKKAL
ncbi:hypothetical protein DM02DRAFT_689914 [Periconia macrospinosa]|uniref:Methyltransferase type 12 domain-containing protein n=1 Tax=Periconia macrospinosa TaxID=97972 RepID=A0A2V1DBR6_9PLEO|nr:hypothetical protein DM02DRAFT_689914 [Periconia macrospinosa]